MRFCPFCAQELQDQTEHCAYCGKRLPSATPNAGAPEPPPKKTILGMSSPMAPPPPQPQLRPPSATPPPPSAPPPRRADPAPSDKRTVFGYNAPPRQPAAAPADPTAPGWATRPPSPQGQPGASPQGQPGATPPGRTPMHAASPTSPAPIYPSPPMHPSSAPTIISGAGLPAPGGPTRPAPSEGSATIRTAAVPPPPSPVGSSGAWPPPRGVAPGVSNTPNIAPANLAYASPPPPPAVAPTMISPGALPPPPPPAADPGVAPTMYGGLPALTGPHPPAAPVEALAPAAAPPARVSPTAAAQRASLPPMPSDGPPGFFGGLPYWFSVMGARRKRGSVNNLYRREIASEEKRLEEFLRDLGKRARELGLAAPAIDVEMQNLLVLEAQRDHTRAGSAELDAKLQAEEAAFNQQNQGLNDRIAAAQAKVNGLGATLKEQSGGLQAAKTKLAALEKELKGLAGQRDARRNEATKAKDPDKKQDLEGAAAELAVSIGDKERARELAAAEVSAAEAPVAETTAALTAERAQLQAAQRELAEAKAALSAKQREAQGEQRKQAAELTAQEKQIAQKFLEIGRLLDGSRVPRPELAELYGRIDETRAGVADRQQQIAELEAERDAYDHVGTRNGKILLASIAGFIVAVTVTLVILFTFVFD